MCPKSKMKICLMRQATMILSVSIVTQVISFFIPYWVHVEIDRRNVSDVIYDVTQNTSLYNYNDMDIKSYNNEDGDGIIGAWRNMTNVTEHRANRSYAIWYIGTCIDGTCYTDMYPDEVNGTYNIQSYYEPGYNFSWVDERIPFSRQKRFQTYVTISLVVSFVTVIFIFDHKRRYKRETTGHTGISRSCHSGRIVIALALILASGMLLWIPSLAYGNVNKQLYELDKKEILDSSDYRSVTVHAPVALMFAAISLISLALAFISVFVAYLMKLSENKTRRTVSIALVPLEYSGARRSVREQSDYAQGGNIFVRAIPYASPMHAGDHLNDNINIMEPPPPSYEETMRLYEAKDESNMYTRENGKDT